LVLLIDPAFTGGVFHAFMYLRISPQEAKEKRLPDSNLLSASTGDNLNLHKP
jgi:hypothetical protein